MILDRLTLIGGAPIPIPELKTTIVQPTMNDIALIGEKKIYTYLSYFKIDKENVLDQITDPNLIFTLEQFDDFEIFLFFINNNTEIQIGISTMLALLFNKLNKIEYNNSFIEIFFEEHSVIINNTMFDKINNIIAQIFCFDEDQIEKKDNQNTLVKKINDKLKERNKKLSKQNNSSSDDDIFSNLISVLAIGSNGLTLDDLMKMTPYQLINLMKRFGLYSQYNVQIQAMMQGAEDIELVDWTQKI